MLVAKANAAFLTVAIVCFAPPGLAQDDAQPPSSDWTQHTPHVMASGNAERTESIRRVLSQPLTSVGLEFQGAPLHEVVKFVRAEYELEIQTDLTALDDLGLSPDDPVDVNLRNISLASALRLMLRPLDLTYVVADEVLLITTHDEAQTRLTTAVYPVGDLLTPLPPATNNDDKAAEPVGYDVDSLIDAIISCVAADTWVENGGPEAEIRPLQPGLFIITQTQDVHEQIANLLAAIRKAKQHEFAVPHAESAGSRPTSQEVEEAYRNGEQLEQGGGIF